MTFIFDFFKRLWAWIGMAFEYVMSIGPALWLFATTFCSSIALFIAKGVSIFEALTSMFTASTGRVEALSDAVAGNEWGLLLCHVFALDVAGQYMASVVTLAAGVLGFLFLQVICFSFWFWIAPTVIKITLRIIRLVSAGFVKP